MSGGTSRNRKDSAVDPIGSSYLGVVPLQIQAAKKIPEALKGDLCTCAAHTLAGSNTANIFIFKRCKKVWEEIVWPENMVIT